MKKHLTLLICFVLTCGTLFSQIQKYSRVKVYTGTEGLSRMASLGVVVDHGYHKKGVFYTSDFSEAELAIIKQCGLKYEVLIDDVSAFYEQRNYQNNSKTDGYQAPHCDDCLNGKIPVNFGYGSMGGFYTYTELQAVLDSMTKKFPQLITAKQPLDNTTTAQGRKVFYVKISDNPNNAETEPQVLYTSLHHAREAESMAQLLYYMWYLLENYATHPEIKYLVDHTELYFIPCVNPDGYVYNQTTNPNGGGMQRKNRSANSDGTYGTDLNRNYGYKWGFDNQGSSPLTNSDTYRGASAFSEKETQMMKNFCTTHKFKIAVNYHGFGNMIIYPWGYQANLYTPDDAIYKKYSELMAQCNSYLPGTPNNTVGYTGNGNSDDWMYGEQASKPSIIEFSPEVGTPDDGFWPAKNRIIPIAQNLVQQNISIARLAGVYAEVKNTSEILGSQTKDYIYYSIQRLGLEPGTFTVELKPLSSNIIAVGGIKTYSGLSSVLETQKDSIEFTLSPGMAQGEVAKFALSVNNGVYSWQDTLIRVFGTVSLPFSDNCNSLAKWSAGGWGISTSTAVSPSGSITDSPSGNYAANISKTISTSNSIDLTDAVAAELVYYTRWDIDPSEDYVEVLVAGNGGSFTPLCANYTSSGGYKQDADKPLYKNKNTNWVKEMIDLSDYVGQKIKIAFKLVSGMDGGGLDGFYFDDVKIKKIAKDANSVNDLHQQASALQQNFPNPCFDVTTINYRLADASQTYYLSVYNNLGEEVLSTQLNNSSTSVLLQVSGLENGVYTYRIHSQGQKAAEAFRLVVMK